MEKEKIIIEKSPSSSDLNGRDESLKEFSEKIEGIKDLKKVSKIIDAFFSKRFSAHPIMQPFFTDSDIKAFGEELGYEQVSVQPKRRSRGFSSFLDVEFEFKGSPNAPDIKGKFEWCDFDVDKTFKSGNDYMNRLTLNVKGEKTYKVYVDSTQSRGQGDMTEGITMKISETN